MPTGGCNCGAVRFSVPQVRENVSVCHCSQCRRFSGHQWAATHAVFADMTFAVDDGLTWYTSSDWAKRGFCNRCGSALFYRMNDEDGIGIAAGCLDQPTGLRVNKHIFVKDKADYFEIGDGVPQIERY